MSKRPTLISDAQTSRNACVNPSESDAFEICSQVPKELGVGESKVINLFSGICLCIVNSRYYKNFESKIEDTSPYIGFGFCLSGQTNIRQDCLKHELFITGNQSAFYYFPNMKSLCKVNPEITSCSLSILMEPDFFRSLLEEEHHYESMGLRKLVEKKNWNAFRHVNIITPAMQLIVKQIVNCPYHGLKRRFFYEAKVMELIFHKLKQLESIKIETGNSSPLKNGDIERIYLAKELLTKNLQNPPGLVELSRSAGLSRTRLLENFSKVFGTSPYKYLRNARLEKAGILFNEGETNVTEAAQAVGYSSLSHFIKAFKEYYGMTPSHYLRE